MYLYLLTDFRKSVDISTTSLCLEPPILEKPLYYNRFSLFRRLRTAGCMRIYRFATKGQITLFMDFLWSLIMLISSFIGKKYLGYFFCNHVILIHVNWASSDLRFPRFVFQLLAKSAT